MTTETVSPVSGRLRREEQTLAVSVTPASRYALWVRFPDGDLVPHGEAFSELTLTVEDADQRLGPCRFLTAPNISGHAGLLVPTGEVVDFQCLLSRGRRVTLQQDLLNLPLVFAHRRTVQDDFRDYTADLTYDLSVYRHFFDRLDAEIEGEPEGIREEVERAILETEGKKMLADFDERLGVLNRLVRPFTADEHHCHGYYFRRQVWQFIRESPFLTRINVKPRGYAGDSVMMRMIYDNRYEGASSFGKLLHAHPINCPAAQAVRNRRTLVARRLSEIVGNRSPVSGKRLQVLSVACGPARELRDILRTPEDCDRYRFALLDQDPAALTEAARQLHKQERSLGARVRADFFRTSVRRMLAARDLDDRLGRFDFIYSMGLFDYLLAPVARGVLAKLYKLLRPGGELVVGNYHVDNPSRSYMEYWGDWSIRYRTEERFIDLIRGFSPADTEVTFEDTRVQMFLRLRRED